MPNFGEKPVAEKPQSKEDGVDTSWVELAGGNVEPGSQIETVQAARVHAAADEKKATAVLEKLRPVPVAAVPEKNVAALNKERAQFQGEFQLRADERNKNRKWYDKLLRRNVMTAEDMAEEEAVKMNKLIKPIVKGESNTGERDALANKLVQRSEFGHKDEATIQEEEMIRKHAPKLVQALEEENFAQAGKLRVGPYDIKDQKERSLAYEGEKKLFNQRVEALILSDDREKMKELVQAYNLDEIGPATLAKMPKEIIQLPNVQRRLGNGINAWILNAGKPDQARKVADQYIALGLMDAAGVAEVINSSEVQQHLSHNIEGTIINARQPDEAKQIADHYVLLGFMTPESVAKVINSPEVQQHLSHNIEGTIINARRPDEAKQIADQYVLLRFMTRVQADKIIADASASRR